MKPGEILYLSRKDVTKLLTSGDCYERCEDVFKWTGQGKVDQLNPVHLWISGEESKVAGSFGAYLCAVKPLSVAGVKWLSCFKGNRTVGLPPITATNVLNDITTGLPLAIIDGTSVTAMRTAGHAGVGAKYCARQDSKTVAIVGCGLQGRAHARIISYLFSIDTFIIYDAVKECEAQYQKDMEGELGIRIVRASSVQEATESADIICMVSSSVEPLLREEWISPGAHVCASALFSDTDPECATALDKWVVGWYERDLAWIDGEEKGKLGGCSEGIYSYSSGGIYADLATEVVPGKKVVRESDDERTIMTHAGMPALDVAVSSLVYEEARRTGAGDVIRLF